MCEKRIILLFGALALLVIVSLGFVARRNSASVKAEEEPDNVLTNVPGMLDHLDFYDSPPAFAAGKAERVNVVATSPAQLVLHDTQGKYPRSGTWTSGEVVSPIPFTELIPSYNPNCPPETGVRIDVRARDASSGKWSDWFYFGRWGRVSGKPKRYTDTPDGIVRTDYLILKRPANAYQARVTFYSYSLDENVNPALRRLTISYSGVAKDAAPPTTLPSIAARDIPVPFRAQGLAAKPLRPEICSPTSLSMVMQHLGVDRPTEENALAIYDDENGLFGNWARAVAWAGQNGFDAWVTRFRNLDQARATLSSGQPIIASVRFREGECPSMVIKETKGHLIVLRGTTADGDFIVNDPASKDRGQGAVYKAEDVNRAWLSHGGVGYVIRKP
jgi:hypothetical protein